MNIVQMDKAGLISLDPSAVNGLLTADEVIHMATVLGAFWAYDYEAGVKGTFVLVFLSNFSTNLKG